MPSDIKRNRDGGKRPAAGDARATGPRRLAVLAVSCWMALHAAPAPADDATGPSLRRGVSVAGWFTDAQNRPLLPADFNRIKQAGFDHVRIPANPEFLGFSLFDAEDGRVLFDFSKLDVAVDQARDSGLAVILDLHLGETVENQIEQDPRAARSFVNLWAHIAEHYKSYPGGTIAFEIMSEPRYTADLTPYRALARDAVAAVRRSMPEATIVVDVPKGASLEGFEGFAPLDDGKLVYAFHFYDPYLFTHQGLKAPASRGYAIRSFHELPYPSASADAKADYAPGAADPIEARQLLTDYISANWNAAHIAARIALAARWAKANDRAVMCTEFGVVRNSAAPEARYRWIADTRQALEAGGIGWDLWDYADAFAVTAPNEDAADARDGSTGSADPDQGTRDIDPAALTALFQ